MSCSLMMIKVFIIMGFHVQQRICFVVGCNICSIICEVWDTSFSPCHYTYLKKGIYRCIMKPFFHNLHWTRTQHFCVFISCWLPPCDSRKLNLGFFWTISMYSTTLSMASQWEIILCHEVGGCMSLFLNLQKLHKKWLPLSHKNLSA